MKSHASLFLCSILSVQTLLALDVQAQTATTAVLGGHAYLPSTSTIAPPTSAGELFQTSGKFTNSQRTREAKLGAISANTFVGDAKYPRASGGTLPVLGQSVQGFSGIVSLGHGEFLTLTDNGFGNKVNSMDALLMVHHVKADWVSGKVQRLKTTFLSDPDKKIPFFIQNENTKERYLTGSDLDIESIQVIGSEWWIGDEFGPYVIKTDNHGKVLALVEAEAQGKIYRSPDHYLHARPPTPSVLPFNVRRSGGFEPMAKSPDGGKLYPMFEWPLWDEITKDFEKSEGKTFTRMLQLDVATMKYTDQQWKYRFEQVGNIAADFQLVNEHIGLVIERDDASEGVAPACPAEPRTDCFTMPAKFKRIYKIDLAQKDAGGFVKKVAFIDLLAIANPKGLAKLGANEAMFALPHLGPEGLAVVDKEHIVVVNDNNYPYSSGRKIGGPDHNELTLLNIKDLLEAK
jgi:hypothetical protein